MTVFVKQDEQNRACSGSAMVRKGAKKRRTFCFYRRTRLAPALSSHKCGAFQLLLAAVYLYGINAFAQMLQTHGVAVAACRKGSLVKQLSANRIDTDGERTCRS